MGSSLGLVLLVSLVACASACSKSTDSKEFREWSQDPPPQVVTIPEAVSIAVTIDGAAKSPITTDLLRAIPPDFADPERRAWRIAKLIEGVNDATVEASTPSGMALKFPRETAALEVVLYLTRRGEIVVAALDPQNPFPHYHGLGGRLHRGGDSMPRVSNVDHLDVRHVAL